MKTALFFCTCIMLFSIGIKAQVKQINNNNSLQVTYPLGNNKTIVVSEIDSSIWVTDATLPGTVQISPDIKFEYDFSLLSGKLIFRGSTAATGAEVYITDGTPTGTILVSDIVTGAIGSAPANMVLMNGFIYFTAETAAQGRELWRTDGTPGGTTLVKDIISGTDGAFSSTSNELFSNGTYLLFAGNTPSSGIELYKSDGTSGGTDVLKDINPSSDSSNPRFFYQYNSITLFAATDADHGGEIWKTDGTTGGTVLLKDINVGTGSSTTLELIPGFPAPIFFSFHLFNNKLFFNASDGTSNGQIWSTDGTEANTVLLKDVVPTIGLAFILLVDAINLPGKFIFPVSDGVSSSELWQSDGTPAGTTLFKSFSPASPEPPIILITFSVTDGTLTQPLFQGNKFFFIANTATEGRELWISDGTLANTAMVKDINAGTGDGISTSFTSYVYTTTELFFSADDGTNGNELWRTDGTEGGTSMVFDINPNAGDSDPLLYPILSDGKIIFSATDGDPNLTDLYVLDGTFSPLPVRLTDFTVSLKADDALLQWSTSQELNGKDFTIQRSYDAQHFENIGVVQASGTVFNRHSYSFKDAGIVNSGKDIVFYRLVVSDKDGKTENTNIISLKLKGVGKWNVLLLSNPVGDNLKILLSGTTGKVVLSVRDVSGKAIYTNSIQNMNGQISLPANVRPGIYVLTVETNNDRKVIRFVKQ